MAIDFSASEQNVPHGDVPQEQHDPLHEIKIPVPLTEAEFEELRDYTDRGGVSLGEFTRNAVLRALGHHEVKDAQYEVNDETQ
jgi:hypothetical protein